LYEENSKNGCSDSSTAAGIVYVEGFDRGQINLNEGSKYIKKAAEQGNLQGKFEVRAGRTK